MIELNSKDISKLSIVHTGSPSQLFKLLSPLNDPLPGDSYDIELDIMENTVGITQTILV